MLSGKLALAGFKHQTQMQFLKKLMGMKEEGGEEGSINKQKTTKTNATGTGWNGRYTRRQKKYSRKDHKAKYNKRKKINEHTQGGWRGERGGRKRRRRRKGTEKKKKKRHTAQEEDWVDFSVFGCVFKCGPSRNEPRERLD